jgi:hypothetical protein
MCQILDIEVKPGEWESLQSTDDLRRFFDLTAADLDPDAAEENACLCGIDLESIVKRAGRIPIRNDWGFELGL